MKVQRGSSQYSLDETGAESMTLSIPWMHLLLNLLGRRTDKILTCLLTYLAKGTKVPYPWGRENPLKIFSQGPEKPAANHLFF